MDPASPRRRQLSMSLSAEMPRRRAILRPPPSEETPNPEAASSSRQVVLHTAALPSPAPKFDIQAAAVLPVLANCPRTRADAALPPLASSTHVQTAATLATPSPNRHIPAASDNFFVASRNHVQIAEHIINRFTPSRGIRARSDSGSRRRRRRNSSSSSSSSSHSHGNRDSSTKDKAPNQIRWPRFYAKCISLVVVLVFTGVLLLASWYLAPRSTAGPQANPAAEATHAAAQARIRRIAGLSDDLLSLSAVLATPIAEYVALHEAALRSPRPSTNHLPRRRADPARLRAFAPLSPALTAVLAEAPPTLDAAEAARFAAEAEGGGPLAHALGEAAAAATTQVARWRLAVAAARSSWEDAQRACAGLEPVLLEEYDDDAEEAYEGQCRETQGRRRRGDAESRAALHGLIVCRAVAEAGAGSFHDGARKAEVAAEELLDVFWDTKERARLGAREKRRRRWLW